MLPAPTPTFHAWPCRARGRSHRAGLKALALALATALAWVAPAWAHDDLDRTLARMGGALQVAPSDALEWRTRAELHRLAGDLSAARADLDVAGRIDPTAVDLAVCRGALALDEGESDEALAALDDALARAPGRVDALELRARVHEARGDHASAARDLRRAVALRPRPTPGLVLALARATTAASGPEAGLRTLEGAMERSGRLVSLEWAATDFEVRLGRYDEALGRLDRLGETLPRPEYLLGRRAEILRAAGRSEEAERVAAAASADLLSRRAEHASLDDPIPAAEPDAADVRSAVEVAAPRTSASATSAIQVSRGPYLQVATPTSVRIRWRTQQATESVVRYGTSPGSLTSTVEDATPRTEHELLVSDLAPETRYYYRVGDLSGSLDDDVSPYTTAPTVGTVRPTRVWVIGDGGTANANAAAVRNAFETYSAADSADLWLMLGDNAYSVGTDAEYQVAVFNMYPDVLRSLPLWPTRGNHDALHAGANNDYYDIFTLPTAGEAGGVPSGTEAYYSFDVANIHFVCLDSEGTNRGVGGDMAVWLRADLAATEQDWVIAYWHHPPYTKGSHNSDDDGDSGGRMGDMREVFVAILDSAGVDLTLTGHSHSYERSYLIDGHYGTSGTLNGSMILDDGDGWMQGDGPYVKPTLGTGPHEGTVHTVAGSSGQISGGSLNHPVMRVSLNLLGSMVLDFNGPRLDARFLNTGGTLSDEFTIYKGNTAGIPVTPAPPIPAVVPNPFKWSTRVGYTVPAAGLVELSILDVRGRKVKSLVRRNQPAGEHSAVWDGTDSFGRQLGRGIYFAVVETGGRTSASKISFAGR